MNKSDLKGLPDNTKLIIDKFTEFGFSREQVFGFVVLTGMYAGVARTQDEIGDLYSNLQLLFPIDRSKNIDDVIGEVYSGYDRQINEFCFRSGADFNFREVKVPNVDRSFFIVYLQDEKLLSTKIRKVKSLMDSYHLCDAFIEAIGKSSINSKHNILQAFQCGMFQMMLHSQIDANGSRQIVETIKYLLPVFYNECLFSIISGQSDSILNLLPTQIPLSYLAKAMDHEYAKQFWGFQSRLFYKDQLALDGIENLALNDWHSWVFSKAEEFDESFPIELKVFSSSNISLDIINLPKWKDKIRSFKECDNFIDKVWGYSEKKIKGNMQILEYKAFLVHTIYSSLTSSREVKH